MHVREALYQMSYLPSSDFLFLIVVKFTQCQLYFSHLSRAAQWFRPRLTAHHQSISLSSISSISSISHSSLIPVNTNLYSFLPIPGSTINVSFSTVMFHTPPPRLHDPLSTVHHPDSMTTLHAPPPRLHCPHSDFVAIAVSGGQFHSPVLL